MELVLWPADILKRKCEPIDIEADTEFRGQLEKMTQLCRALGGLGLAANQVGLTKRMLVAAKPGKGLVAFVNPRMVGLTGDRYEVKEGCLSIPGYFELTKRSTSCIVESTDLETGAIFVQEYEGKLAHVLQHEIEHLDGKMFIDRLPGGKRDQLRQYMRKLRGARR